MELTEIKVELPEPHPGQQKVLDSKARWKVLMCGRRWGKTLICQIIAINKMLAGQSVAYVTPQHSLGREFFQAILDLLPPEIVARDNQTERKIELVTGGHIQFFSGEALDSFRGLKFHTVIVDEASIIPDLKSAWNKAIRPTLADYQGDAIFISTPNGKEFFYSLYQRGKNGEPGYESFHYTSYDNPHLSKDEWDEMKKDIPEAEFRQEVLAIAGENADNPFGTDNVNANVIKVLSGDVPVVYGIDVAKHKDYTVITGLDNQGHMAYFERFQTSWTDAMERIARLPGGVLKVMDSTGAGDVMFEQLQMTCSNLIGFTFTETSKRDLMKELIYSVQKGDVKYNEMTADEMHVFQYTRTATGNYKYGAKSGYHDDCVMALALANKYRQQAVHTANWTLYSA